MSTETARTDISSFISRATQPSFTEIGGGRRTTNYAREPGEPFTNDRPLDRLTTFQEVSPTKSEQFELPLETAPRSVAAVVSSVDDASIGLRCQLPNRVVELLLPRSLISDDLAKYGTPVQLELDPISSYRRLRISGRTVERSVETEDTSDIERWLRD